MLVFWKTQLMKLETGKRKDFRYVYLKESEIQLFKGPPFEILRGRGVAPHPPVREQQTNRF